MLPTIDQKYVSFKREDWLAFCEGMGEEGVHCDGSKGIYITDLADRTIHDGIVLRMKDVFTATALHAYTNAVQNAIEVLEHINAPVPEYLYQVRDYFHGLAQASGENTERKLPD